MEYYGVISTMLRESSFTLSTIRSLQFYEHSGESEINVSSLDTVIPRKWFRLLY